MSHHGHLLKNPDAGGIFTCPESGLRYKEEAGVLHCIDLDEEAPLPPEMAMGKEFYDTIKAKCGESIQG